MHPDEEPQVPDEPAQNAGDGAPPAGFRAVEIAAEGDPSPGAALNALAYFMGDEAPPGTGEITKAKMDFGRADGRLVEVTLRTLGIEELDKCNALARKAFDANAEMGDLGLGYFRWSYVFAYACTDPNLGDALAAQRARAEDAANNGDQEAKALLKRLTDTAALTREVFRKRGGVLQHVVFALEAKAKLGDTGVGSVSLVEVEAGKA